MIHAGTAATAAPPDITPPASLAPAVTDVPDAAPLPVNVAATDPTLYYSGRFKNDNAGMACQWPASAVTLRFSGMALNVRLADDKGANRWQIVLDGKPTGVLALLKGAHTYSVADHLSDGPHTAQLVRCTEAVFGVTRVNGFELNAGGHTLPAEVPRRRIEIVGDSISCGYGDEAASQAVHFSAGTENAWLAYGAVAARLLDADYTCIAWSGKKLWPDNSIIDLYRRTLPVEPVDNWDFKAAPAPDVLVITLGTNDFNAKVLPDATGWANAYKTFVTWVRRTYPGVTVYCATSPMLGGNGPTGKHAILQDWLTKIVGDLTAAGDKKVYVVDFPTQDIKTNGVGADWHPSVKTQGLMGQQLAEAIKEDLGW